MKLHVCLSALLAVMASGQGVQAATPDAYRDLNHNGRRDVYEDAGQSIDARVDDLVRQMTLEEKVGAMMHGSLPAGDELGDRGAM